LFSQRVPVPHTLPAQQRAPWVPHASQVLAPTSQVIPEPLQVANAQQVWLRPPQPWQVPIAQFEVASQPPPLQQGPFATPHWVQVPLTQTSAGPQPPAPGQHGPPRVPQAVQVPVTHKSEPPLHGVIELQHGASLPPQVAQRPWWHTVPS
jgi:hypothetical protein